MIVKDERSSKHICLQMWLFIWWYISYWIRNCKAFHSLENERWKILKGKIESLTTHYFSVQNKDFWCTIHGYLELLLLLLLVQLLLFSLSCPYSVQQWHNFKKSHFLNVWLFIISDSWIYWILRPIRRLLKIRKQPLECIVKKWQLIYLTTQKMQSGSDTVLPIGLEIPFHMKRLNSEYKKFSGKIVLYSST